MTGDAQQGGKSPNAPTGVKQTPSPVRGSGRELALAVMCAMESYAPDDIEGRTAAVGLTLSNPPRGDADGESAFSELVASPAGRQFAEELLAVWVPRQAEFDETIERVSRRWRVSRMDSVDRNVVRLATAELAGRPDTPRGVVLSEAVRIARRYGSERSARFVNGLVESLAQELRPAAEAGGSADGGSADGGSADGPNKPAQDGG